MKGDKKKKIQICVKGFTGHSYPVMAIDISPDERHFVSCSLDGTVRVWDLVTKKLLRVMIGFRGEVDLGEDHSMKRLKSMFLSISNDGRYVMCTGQQIRKDFDGYHLPGIKIWEMETGRLIFEKRLRTEEVLAAGLVKGKEKYYYCVTAKKVGKKPNRHPYIPILSNTAFKNVTYRMGKITTNKKKGWVREYKIDGQIEGAWSDGRYLVTVKGGKNSPLIYETVDLKTEKISRIEALEGVYGISGINDYVTYDKKCFVKINEWVYYFKKESSSYEKSLKYQLFDVKTGSEVVEKKKALTPEGKEMLKDLRDGKYLLKVMELPGAYEKWRDEMLITSDGKYLVTSHNKAGLVQVWDVQTSRLISKREIKAEITLLTVNKDISRPIAVCHHKNTTEGELEESIATYDLLEGKRLSKTALKDLVWPSYHVWYTYYETNERMYQMMISACITANGRYLTTGWALGEVIVIDMADDMTVKLGGKSSVMWAAFIAPNPRFLLTVDVLHNYKLEDLVTGYSYGVKDDEKMSLLEESYSDFFPKYPSKLKNVRFTSLGKEIEEEYGSLDGYEKYEEIEHLRVEFHEGKYYIRGGTVHGAFDVTSSNQKLISNPQMLAEALYFELDTSRMISSSIIELIGRILDEGMKWVLTKNNCYENTEPGLMNIHSEVLEEKEKYRRRLLALLKEKGKITDYKRKRKGEKDTARAPFERYLAYNEKHALKSIYIEQDGESLDLSQLLVCKKLEWIIIQYNYNLRSLDLTPLIKLKNLKCVKINNNIRLDERPIKKFFESHMKNTKCSSLNDPPRCKDQRILQEDRSKHRYVEW